ncbi:MAG TPA: hypothetical protein VGL13_15710 [Polyangiaceae bacterium]
MAESRGVVRDVLAAVGNLQHLLRSPRVGGKALAQVIPGLRGQSDSLLASIEQILEHARRAAPTSIEPAATQLHRYATSACELLRIALDRVARQSMDAKTRLSFEADIVKCDAELNSARQLLDLLIHATEHAETDLFIEEVVRVAFSTGSRSVSGTNLVRLTASYARDGSGFRASAQVIASLLVIAAGWVRMSSGGQLYLSATCREDEPVVVTISYDGPQDGEQLAFEPPLIVAPTLACAETAARLVHASFEAEADRVVIWLPRTA